MKYPDTKIAIGGLMRCCTATIAAYVEAHKDDDEVVDQILDCTYEEPGNARIILEDGVWRWNRPRDESW